MRSVQRGNHQLQLRRARQPTNIDNLTTGASTVYSYNTRNRLNGVQQNGSTVATYTYDDAGHRIQQSTGSTTNYIWDEMSMYSDVILETKATTGNSFPKRSIEYWIYGLRHGAKSVQCGAMG